MSSLKRILSSRTNGARTHGPVTPEGKQRSSVNALRHGLLARCVVLENESREGFDALLADFVDRFDPADGVEFGMVEEMLSSLWRQRRAWAIETRLVDTAVAGQPVNPDAGSDEVARLTAAYTALSAQPQLALIQTYETRLHRMFQRALHNLLLLRSVETTPVNETKEINEPSSISEH